MGQPGDGVTVLANVAIDRIDGAAPTPGGCPAFAAAALEPFGGGRVVTRAAAADVPLFEPILVPAAVDEMASPRARDDVGGARHAERSAAWTRVELMAADCTAAFSLDYDERGDGRTLRVDAIGPVWTPADLATARVDTRWVHLAPLLRSDFPAATVGRLAADGHRVAFDGQGLVRAAAPGPLRLDGAFDRALLEAISILKLADDEAAVLTGGEPFGPEEAARLGVPEILVTHGSRGCDLYLAAERATGRAPTVHRVAPAWRVEGVHATGAGDVFTVAYVAGRASGADPIDAAAAASRLVAELLQVRAEAQP